MNGSRINWVPVVVMSEYFDVANVQTMQGRIEGKKGEGTWASCYGSGTSKNDLGREYQMTKREPRQEIGP